MPLTATMVMTTARAGLRALLFLGSSLSLAGCAGAVGVAAAPRLATFALTHVSVVDVERGRLVADQTVVVRDGRIATVRPAAEVAIPPGADVLDGSGRFLAPGFADMHVHLYTEGDLFTYVANGVTTVRNMAGDTTHLAMRARVASGRLVGPRIITAGPVVEAAPLSHPDNVLLESPAAVRGELERQRAAGYDFVKVYNRLARPEVSRLSLTGLPTDGAKTSYLRQFTDSDYVAAQRGLDAQFRLARSLSEAGAGLLVGTDSWLAGYAYVDELELFVRAGLTPARVLRMATLDAARFLGEDAAWGAITAGRRADLVLLDGDPLADAVLPGVPPKTP